MYIYIYIYITIFIIVQPQDLVNHKSRNGYTGASLNVMCHGSIAWKHDRFASLQAALQAGHSGPGGIVRETVWHLFS